MTKAKIDSKEFEARYPALKTELKSVLELTNDPRNVRLHDEKNIAAIVESLQRFGQRKPIVVTKAGIVIAGNGTLEAARRLAWDRVLVAPAPENEQDQLAYGIADNRTAELATWDGGGLAKILEELQAADYSTLSTGFSQDEVARLIAASQQAMDLAGPANPPEAPKLVNPPEPGAPSPGLPESLAGGGVRVVQLFMSGTDHAQWEVAVKSLGAQHGCKNVSDTVLAVVFDAAGVARPKVSEAPGESLAATGTGSG